MILKGKCVKTLVINNLIMKSFLKYTAATIVGICLSTFLLFILLIIIIGASSSEKPVEVKSNTILYLDLNKRIVERAVDNPFDFLPLGAAYVQEMGLNDILANIRKAEKDENISGIYMEMKAVSAGFGSIEEIRNALIDFKKSGKFIVAFGDYYTQKSYYLASVADKIYLNPSGEILFVGYGSEIMFYKGALDKLGIEVQVVRHGDYKSFVEPFTNEKMSPESREQMLTWVGSLWNHTLKGISDARNIDVSRLNEIADQALIRSADHALRYKLVDSLFYKDQVIADLKAMTDTPEQKDLRSISLKKYTKVFVQKEYKGLAKEKIAVIYAHGDVILGNMGEGTIASERISKAIRQARRDSTVKAIVIRVNSGGGSALAADVIWREAYLASKAKPLVASIGDVAASGGYYFIAAADTILASPNSITGSIGVFAMIPNAQSFFNKKLGITVDVAKTNKHSDLVSIFRPLSGEEKEYLQYGVEEVYDSFLSRVSEGRNMTVSDVDAIGGGRVWSGENAVENGLIDMYGGLQDAIEVAAGMAGLEKYRVQELPRLENPLDVFLRELTENTRSRIAMKELGEFYRYFETIDNIQNYFGIQARIPYIFDIH